MENPDAQRACYRLGDALLDIASNSPQLIEALENRYGDCAVPADPADAGSRVRCSAHLCSDGQPASVRFSEPAAVDLFGAALSLLKHPAADPLFVEGDLAIEGWRFIVRARTGGTVTAVCGAVALIDLELVPAEFLVDLIVNPVLAIQRELLFAHAASVGIGDAGVLLIGASGSGKTTTALTLAARGHAYFGDDMAAIRTASAELLPFRSTANIRPGPHASALANHINNGLWDPPHSDGIARLRLRVTESFPSAAATALPLRHALFLRRFAAAPEVEPFTPTLEALGSASPLALNNALWLAWGTSPHRRLLQFMLFVRMLSRVRCAWLDVGAPEATADLIETMTEEAWDFQ